MCILRFHARAGYLQTYETMLDQLMSHPDSDQVQQDQYDVERHTFEELTLPFKGPMEDAGVVKLYEPSPTPCLYVAPVQNMVGSISKLGGSNFR